MTDSYDSVYFNLAVGSLSGVELCSRRRSIAQSQSRLNGPSPWRRRSSLRPSRRLQTAGVHHLNQRRKPTHINSRSARYATLVTIWSTIH